MRTILVDAFGTIVETRPSWIEVRTQCFRECASVAGLSLDAFLPVYMDERRRDHERAPGDWREFDFVGRFARTFARLGVQDAAQRAPAAAAAYHAFQGRLVAPLPDARVGLTDLASLGPLVLVSNYPHGPSLVAALERSKLAHFFSDFVVSGDVGWLKPAPEIFLEASRRAKADPGRCVMVGNDAHDDVAGARAVGMDAILVAYPRESEHAVPDGALGVAGDLPEAAAILRDRGQGS